MHERVPDRDRERKKKKRTRGADLLILSRAGGHAPAPARGTRAVVSGYLQIYVTNLVNSKFLKELFQQLTKPENAV